MKIFYEKLRGGTVYGAYVLKTAAAFLLSAACIAAVSCSALTMEDDGKTPKQKRETSFTPNASMSDSTHVKLTFLREVSKLETVALTPDVAIKNPDAEVSGNSKDKWSVVYELEEALEVGKEYSISGTVSNKAGRTELFSVSFMGANESETALELEITEVHPMYDAKNKRSEYVKLRVKSGGNLFGIRIYSAHDKLNVYTFPAVMVASGETIAIHLRSNAAGAVNELSDNLSESSAVGSANNVRDFWADNKKTARLGDDADIILVRNAAGNKIFDAVLYSPSNAQNWKPENLQKSLQKAAEEAVNAGKWLPDARAENAAVSDKIAAVKALVKTGVTNEKTSWTVRDIE